MLSIYQYPHHGTHWYEIGTLWCPSRMPCIAPHRGIHLEEKCFKRFRSLCRKAQPVNQVKVIKVEFTPVYYMYRHL